MNSNDIPNHRFLKRAEDVLKQNSVTACARAYIALQDALSACENARRICKEEGNVEHSHQWETLRDTLVILVDCEATEAYEAIADETRMSLRDKLLLINEQEKDNAEEGEGSKQSQ